MIRFFSIYRSLSNADSARLSGFLQRCQTERSDTGLTVLGCETIFASMDSSRAYSLSLWGCLLLWTETFPHLAFEIHFIQPRGRYPGGSRASKKPPSAQRAK